MDRRYAYVHDLQGDICQIVDANGTVVVEYTYNAWGKVLNVTGSMASTLGTIQPFRYRGYVYDVETELYYLRSRYYNPELNRFINTDAQIGTIHLSDNIYNYCHNNPTNLCDKNGYSWFDDAITWIKDTIIKPTSDFISGVVESYQQTQLTKAKLTRAAAKSVNDSIDNVIKTIKNCWDNDIVPWIKQTATTVQSYIKDALKTQTEANIMSIKMQYHAGKTIISWVSDNWIGITDWITALGGFAGTAYGIVQAVYPALALPAIPVVGQVFLLCGAGWGIVRLAGFGQD